MAVQVAVMGGVTGLLFEQSLPKFIPYVTAGFIVWSFLTSVLNEGAMCFISSSNLMLQSKRPLFAFVLLAIWRNIMILGHTFAIYVIVAIVFTVTPTIHTLLLIPGLFLVSMILGWAVLLFGALSARFRDIPMMLQNVITFLFWLTPVIYFPEQLGRHSWISDLNPLTHVMNVLRLPAMGVAPAPTSWGVVAALALGGWLCVFFFYVRFRARVPYWL